SSTIGLDNVAIKVQGTLAERFQVKHCTQAAPDQALDFLRTPALLSTCGFAVTTGMGRARKHAIFCSHPALPLPLQKRRNFLQSTGVTQDTRLAHGDEDRPFGITGIAHLNTDGSQRIGGATGCSKKFRCGGRHWDVGHMSSMSIFEWVILSCRPYNVEPPRPECRRLQDIHK